jgi:transcriptional regulator with XRE-family HTH domain
MVNVRRRSMPDLQAIGRRIRSLRANTRQVEFASQLRISQGQLSKIERGEVAPTLDVLVQLSTKFRKTIDWIIVGDD